MEQKIILRINKPTFQEISDTIPNGSRHYSLDYIEEHFMKAYGLYLGTFELETPEELAQSANIHRLDSNPSVSNNKTHDKEHLVGRLHLDNKDLFLGGQVAGLSQVRIHASPKLMQTLEEYPIQFTLGATTNFFGVTNYHTLNCYFQLSCETKINNYRFKR